VPRLPKKYTRPGVVAGKREKGKRRGWLLVPRRKGLTRRSSRRIMENKRKNARVIPTQGRNKKRKTDRPSTGGRKKTSVDYAQKKNPSGKKKEGPDPSSREGERREKRGKRN